MTFFSTQVTLSVGHRVAKWMALRFVTCAHASQKCCQNIHRFNTTKCLFVRLRFDFVMRRQMSVNLSMEAELHSSCSCENNRKKSESSSLSAKHIRPTEMRYIVRNRKSINDNIRYIFICTDYVDTHTHTHIGNVSGNYAGSSAISNGNFAIVDNDRIGEFKTFP